MPGDADATPSALAARIAELEARVAFQEHALGELSDALAEARLEGSRAAATLQRVLDELRQLQATPYADPGIEPPPPHY